MADGAPNGWSVMSFNGTEYRLDFHAAGRPEDYQLEIDAPEVVKSAESADAAVYVNVFNGSEKSAVELRVGDGEWRRMTKVDVVDPKFQRTFDREAELLAKKEAWRALPKPKPSTHVWQIGLPDGLTVGTHSLEVRATDYLGREFTGQRIMRVE